MKPTIRLARLFVAALLAALAGAAWCQPAAQAVQPAPVAQAAAASKPSVSLVGTWIVTVKSLPETRTLIVSEEAPTETGALLGARYGITGKGQGPIAARTLAANGLRRLSFVTQADSVVVADEQPDGSFVGTFKFKNGSVKPVLVSRATSAAPSAARAPDPAAPQPLAADTPAHCAAFHGNWAGAWTQGSFGRLFLRVVAIDVTGDKCVARYSFTSAETPPKVVFRAEISDGVLSFVCNRSTGGTCQFKRSGDELWGSYTSTSGNNSGVFRPVPVGAK
jgi:hypothetical protein